MRATIVPVDSLEPEYLFHPPRPLFPNINTRFGEGGAGVVRTLLQANIPPALDVSFDFFRMIQLQLGNLSVANTTFRPFFDITLGPDKLIAPLGVDVRFGTLPDGSSVPIAYHLVKADIATGKIQGFVKPLTTIKDLESFQVDYKKSSAGDASNPNAVWSTSDYDLVYIFENETLPNIDDATPNTNIGTASGTASLVTGLRGLKALRMGTAGSVSIPDNSTIDFGSGSKTIGFFWKNNDTDNGDFVILLSKKELVNNASPGIQIVYHNADANALSVRFNNGTDTVDAVFVIPFSTLALQDDNFHYISLSINSVNNTFMFSIDDDDNLAISGSIGFATSLLTSPEPLELNQEVGTSKLNADWQDFKISNKVRTKEDVNATFNNIINYNTVLRNTSIDLPTPVDTQFFVAVDSTNNAIQVEPLLPEWKNRIDLETFASQVSGNHVDFPLYIELQDDLLKTLTKSDGTDILFTDTDGTPLPHFIEVFDRAAGLLKVHVKRNISSARNTFTYLFFNNSSANIDQFQTDTWTSDVKAVYLFNESDLSIGADGFQDRTANPANTNIQGSTSLTNSIVGQVGNAQGIDNNTEGLISDNSKFKAITDKFTIMAVVKRTSNGSNPIIINIGDAVNQGISLLLAAGSGIPRLNLVTTAGVVPFEAGTSSIAGTGFRVMTFTYDGVNVRGYLDGEKKSTTPESGNVTITGDKAYIAAANNALFWGEIIDDIRFFDTAKSDDFIKTLSNNYLNPSGFSIRTNHAPFHPRNLDAVALINGSIDLSWLAPLNPGASPIIGYKIERKIAPGSYTTIIPDTGNNNVTFNDSTVTELLTYTYRVSAINSIGTSVPSNESTAKAVPSNWLDLAFKKRVKITIQNTLVPSDQTNFPLLVNQIVDGLGTNVELDGKDIRFALADKIPLKYEIQFLDPITGQLISWTKIPTVLSAVDTEVFMYFDNSFASKGEDPPNVWNNNYRTVWHNDTISPAIPDSTVNETDSDNVSGVTVVPGQIGSALDFGTGNNFATFPTISIAQPITVSCWVNYPTSSQDGFLIGKDPVNAEFALFLSGGNLFYRGGTGDANTMFTLPSAGSWHYFVATQDAANNTVLYIDGAQVDTGTTASIPNLSGIVNFGRFFSGFFYNGKMDETRLSTVVRSADYITTEYNNQNDPLNFIDISQVETIE